MAIPSYSIIPSTIDESSIRSKGKSPSNYCQLLASMKSAELSLKYPDAMIFGGDTIVVLDEKIIEKPNNDETKFQILLYSNDEKKFPKK